MNFNELVNLDDQEEIEVTNIYDYFNNEIEELVRIIFNKEEAKYTKLYFNTYLTQKNKITITKQDTDIFDT